VLLKIVYLLVRQLLSLAVLVFRGDRPAGNVHLRSAPRSGLDKAFDILIVPGQEHLLSMARRQAQARGEKPGLIQSTGTTYSAVSSLSASVW
jgi:hypothetical protein